MKFDTIQNLEDGQLIRQYKTFNTTRFLLERAYGANDDQIKPVQDVLNALQAEIDKRGIKSMQ